VTDKKTTVRDFVDEAGFGYRVEFIGDDAWQDFKAYEISSISEPAGTPMFCTENNPVQDTEHIGLAQIFAKGFVKWDGCMEFKLEDSPHFCHQEDAERFGKLFPWIHKTALEIMGR
jgi:hypothetical protein